MKFPGNILKRGDKGEAIVAIQKQLGVQQTGTFGETTEEFVTKFQIAHDLLADGEVGPITWHALFSPQPQPTHLGGAVLKAAKPHIGTKEKPLGSNRGPEVDAWNKRAGVTPGPKAFWCMSFVYCMVDDACNELNISNPLKCTGSCSVQAADAKQRGRLLVTSPRAGDIFLVKGGETGFRHTGIVASDPDDEGRFDSIEGNSNNDGSDNGTCVAHRTKGRLVTKCNFIRL
jgi:peptidoglycan hydrolase-like protein with peptidoglycan-binding domain